MKKRKEESGSAKKRNAMVSRQRNKDGASYCKERDEKRNAINKKSQKKINGYCSRQGETTVSGGPLCWTKPNLILQQFDIYRLLAEIL